MGRARSVAALVVALGLVGAVAACGEEDPQDPASVTGATQADVQVTGRRPRSRTTPR
jgi:hypothetical protein